MIESSRRELRHPQGAARSSKRCTLGYGAQRVLRWPVTMAKRDERCSGNALQWQGFMHSAYHLKAQAHHPASPLTQ
jgi:hypothetical protein